MKVLVLNAGSSSLKYQVIEMANQEVQCKGLVERIGLEDAIFTHQKGPIKQQNTTPILNHEKALELVKQTLVHQDYGVIKSVDEIEAVGHRVVHGGYKFTSSTIITPEVKETIKSLFDLAPLHNPANLQGIEVAEKVFVKAKQVAVFDTAFHQTLPQKAYQYAISKKYLEEDHIRVYGFHGTSHKYVSEIAQEVLGKESTQKMITLHLGNGCSISAILNGKSIDHSLGFGVMNGLVMGTRSGDLDQSVIVYLQNKYGKSANDINQLLQKKSGLYGLTGFHDLRDIESEAEKGNSNCQMALEITTYRIKKYIGSYSATMNGLDTIVFTAGIGENSDVIRRMVCSEMDFFGIEIDTEKNNIRAKEVTEIHTNNSRVKVLIIPTNEELEIAKQVIDLV